jgi:hypothetical protein
VFIVIVLLNWDIDIVLMLFLVFLVLQLNFALMQIPRDYYDFYIFYEQVDTWYLVSDNLFVPLA